MRIAELRLHDVRLFPLLELSFAPGVNLLVGPNGSGKTTVLEAIGFALFGTPPVRGERPTGAIRDGATALSVEARFEHDGRSYLVRRTLGAEEARAELAATDGTGSVLARGEDEVASHIARLFGVAPADLLAWLRRLVGVPQGDVTRPFLLGPADRERHFIPLLALDRYAAAARRAQALATPYTQQLERLALEEAQGKGELKRYRVVQERFEQASGEAQAAERRLGEVRERIDALEGKARALRADRERLDGLVRGHAVAAERLAGVAAEEDRARTLLLEAEAAATAAARAEDIQARYEEVSAEVRELERRGAKEVALRAEVQVLEERLAEGRQAIDAERETLDGGIGANQAETEALLAERDALRARLDELRGQARRLEGMLAALATAAGRTGRLREQLAAVVVAAGSDPELERRETEARRAEERARAAASRARSAEIDSLRTRAEAEDEARDLLNRTREALARLERLVETCRGHLDAVRPAQGACPFLAEPCRNVHGASLVEHFEDELGRLEQSRPELEEGLRLAEARVEEAVQSRRELSRAESPGPQAGAAPPPRPRAPRPRAATRPSDLERIDFDEAAQLLSGLAGVLGVVEPSGSGAGAEVRGLLGGEVAATPARHGRVRPAPIRLPGREEIDRAQSLAHRAAAVARPSTGGGAEGSTGELDEIASALARLVRKIDADTLDAETAARSARTACQADSRAAEDRLLESTRLLQALGSERARLRAAHKESSSRDLALLDTELALTDRRMKLGLLEPLQRELVARRSAQQELLAAHHEHLAHAALAERAEACRERWKQLDGDRREARSRIEALDREIEPLRPAADAALPARIAEQARALVAEQGALRERLGALARERKELLAELAEMEASRQRLEAIDAARARARRGLGAAAELAEVFREMGAPAAAALRGQVALEASRWLARLSGTPGRLEWDQGFGLNRLGRGGRRTFAELACGEQLSAALAVMLALLGQGAAFGLWLLDEPAAHLDAERRSALGRALEEIGARTAPLEQVIVATHDEGLQAGAARVVRLGG